VYGRIDVSEVPFVRGDLTVTVHIEFLEHEPELILGKLKGPLSPVWKARFHAAYHGYRLSLQIGMMTSGP
jgi:hypothetical protein